jgi:hypothetical protein
MRKKPVPMSSALALLFIWLSAWSPGARGDTTAQPDTERYAITANAGAGGVITPSGTLFLPLSSDMTFRIAPEAGYDVRDVLVDGVGLGEISEYTFQNLRAHHTIEALFVKHDEVCPSKRFPDVDTGKWYHKGIDFVLRHGLFGGTSADAFEPDAAMTGAMLVTVLFRLEDVPIPRVPVIRDAEPTPWYGYAAAWAAENHIAEGFGGGAFSPDAPATREQMAVILYRYAAYKGCDTTAANGLSAFTDAGRVSDWARAAVQWAAAEGLMTGVRENTLDPSGCASRAQAAVILMRFLQNTKLFMRQTGSAGMDM